MIDRPAPEIRGPNYLKSRRGASIAEWHRSCSSTGYENRMAIHIVQKTTRRIPMVRWWTKKDRKSVEEGKSVDIGGSRIIKKKGILAAIAIPLYANVQARARIAKAQADTRTLASAAPVYAA